MLTKSYKDNVNAYNPLKWGQKYSKDVYRKLSHGRIKIYKKESPWGLYPQHISTNKAETCHGLFKGEKPPTLV